jgi:nicotinamide mononucleotide transporter
VSGVDTAILIEVAATAAGLAYVVLLSREHILCWPFGIAGSLLSIWLFVHTRLYSEALLYSYYVIMGVWGWLHWHRREQAADNPVLRYAPRQHLLLISLGVAGTLVLGGLFDSYSNAQRPWIDAFTTAFSFVATWLQVRKVLESWLYWIVLNGVSIWLYQDRALDIYAALICFYAVLSVIGFVSWLRSYRRQGVGHSSGVAAL